MPAASPPVPGAAQSQQSAPFGNSPVSGPTPNKGFEAAALKRVGLVVQQLTQLLPMAGANTDLGQAILKAITSLSKHVPSGSVTPADEKASLERQMMANTQNNQQAQQLKQMQAKQQAGGGQQPGAGAAAA